MVWIVMIALVLSYIVVDRYGKQQTKEQNKGFKQTVLRVLSCGSEWDGAMVS
ncbi:uncharacterized protein METZ01_LOCUS97181 [marine metagenome]|uniref:Uncharacterized protein n=1 Tax=marine metagenome TaxID=408172 RepID=A0A381VXG6_9ZZZZ|tara:strand:- start:107 stop:262 length:156 start_codon:yes stop_codon:yes gene_type:complete